MQNYYGIVTIIVYRPRRIGPQSAGGETSIKETMILQQYTPGFVAQEITWDRAQDRATSYIRAHFEPQNPQ